MEGLRSESNQLDNGDSKLRIHTVDHDLHYKNYQETKKKIMSLEASYQRHDM